jgi:hypothetical protein
VRIIELTSGPTDLNTELNALQSPSGRE